MCDMSEECADMYSKMSFVDCPLDDSDWKNCPYYWKLAALYNRAIIAAVNQCVYPLDEEYVRKLMKVVD